MCRAGRFQIAIVSIRTMISSSMLSKETSQQARARPKRSSDPDGEVSRRDRRGVLGGGERDLHWSRFQQLPWSIESVSLKITPKSRLQTMEPTHPDRLVENVTAPSAGGFPGPDGEVRLRKRLPFRTTSS